MQLDLPIALNGLMKREIRRLDRARFTTKALLIVRRSWKRNMNFQGQLKIMIIIESMLLIELS